MTAPPYPPPMTTLDCMSVEVEDPRMAKKFLAALIMQCGGDVVIYPGDLVRTNTRMKISAQPHPASGGILLRAFFTEESTAP